MGTISLLHKEIDEKPFKDKNISWITTITCSYFSVMFQNMMFSTLCIELVWLWKLFLDKNLCFI